MLTPMLADVRRQPEVLASLLGRGGELAAVGRRALDPGPGGCVYAVASGDGWFAARAVSRAARRGLGVPWHATSALPFLAYVAPHLTPADRVVAISMSGNVDRTNEAWRAARARGVPGLVLTNGRGGRLAEDAALTVSLDIPELAPFLCGTSTYTGTVLALVLLLLGASANGAMGAGPSDPEWRPAPAAVGEALGWLPRLLPDADRAATEIAERSAARGASGVRILAAGPHLATAEYGVAKLVELTRVPAWSDDVEEFAHRQFWSADPRDLVVYLAPNAALAARVADAAAALASLGFETWAIESGGHPVPTATRRLELPLTPEWLAALLLPLPLQLLAYRLACATGLDPNTRTHLRDDRARFRVSRLLTRRALVDTGR
jgi:glucosamine 6-phosphate synthetase-like amidotransferase/phosphosugar isomerase protein